MADEGEDIFSAPRSIKRYKDSSTRSEQDELNQILARRAEKARTEEQLRKQEAEKDKAKLIKEVFDKDDRIMIGLVGRAMDEQEAAKAKVLQGDGPPPCGFFDFDFPEPNNVVDNPAVVISNAELVNRSFLAKTLGLKTKVDSNILNFLLGRIVDAPSDDVSTGSADTFVALLAGDESGSRLHSTWLRTTLLPQSDISNSFVDPLWKVEVNAVHGALYKYFITREKKPEQLKRYISVLRTCVRLDKVQSLKDLFCLLVTFACFEPSKAAHACIRLVLADLVQRESIGDLNDLGSLDLTKICLGEFDGKGGVQITTDFQSIVHRTVTISGLMASGEPRSAQVLRHFLNSMVLQHLLVGYAEHTFTQNEHEMFEIGKQELANADPVVRAVFAFLRHDIEQVETLQRSRMTPSVYQTWLSLAKITELVTGDEGCNRATKSFVSKQARYIANTAENVFMDAYMCFIDYLRFLDYLSASEVKAGMTQTDVQSFFKDKAA